MDDEIYEMYNSNEITKEFIDRYNNKTTIVKSGVITEVMIDGEKLLIIDPAIVQNMQNTIKRLQIAVKKLEQDIRNIQTKFGKVDNSIRETKAELNTKVSYND